MDLDDATDNGARNVTPSGLATAKRRFQQNEDTSRRVAQRTGTEPEEEESMRSILCGEDLWSENEETVGEAMRKLWKRLYDQYDDKRAQNQEEFFQLGGHAVVVGVMAKHPESEEVQLHGVCVLHNASYKNARLRWVLGRVGGVEAVLAAMRAFRPPEENFIRHGFCALVNLTFEHKQNSEFLVMESGDMGFLLEQVQRFSDNANIVRSACQLLKKLSEFDELTNALVEAGALSTLDSARERHEESELIQRLSQKAQSQLGEQDWL